MSKKHRSRRIPDEARQLGTRDFETWCEKAGRFEDDGYEGDVADQRALWMIYDQRWKARAPERKADTRTDVGDESR
mgnify:CR=1 FL=1